MQKPPPPTPRYRYEVHDRISRAWCERPGLPSIESVAAVVEPDATPAELRQATLEIMTVFGLRLVDGRLVQAGPGGNSPSVPGPILAAMYDRLTARPPDVTASPPEAPQAARLRRN